MHSIKVSNYSSLIAALSWAAMPGIAAEPVATVPMLSPAEVASLASSAFKSSNIPPNVAYKPDPPEYLAQDHMWRVFFFQTAEMRVIDGDMVVFVNDRTRKACVGQIMAPPIPCI